MKTQWDINTDVIVVGYGLAGAMSAIAAHDAGAKVLLMEKLPAPGGNSILSGGLVICSTNAEDVFKYLGACSGERVDEAVIKFIAQGMVELPGYINKLADAVGATISISYEPWLQYPFPGKESFRTIRVLGFNDQEDIREVKFKTGLKKGATSGITRYGGSVLMNMMFRHVEQRAIEVMLSTPAKRLVQDNEGRVVGLLAESRSREISVKANKAVILACGGFEFNDWLKKQYCEIQPIYGIGCMGNTGDGILMSQKAGAVLWHMWLLHGSYGFKFPEFPYAFRVPFGGALNPEKPAGMVWVLVNKDGKRFMNEGVPYLQDSAYRAIQSMNTDFLSTRTGVPEFTNIPCYMIFDEEARKKGPIAWPRTMFDEDRYEWSEDNMAEVEKGWIKRADTVAKLAKKIKVNAAELERTLDRWNNQCVIGKDTDFSRIPGSMVQIKTPPYYAIECWPILSNTQGGPRFNSKCQVVDPYDEPIPSLYKAGELGSFFGHLYSLGGNLSECIIEGRAAGENAAQCDRC